MPTMTGHSCVTSTITRGVTARAIHDCERAIAVNPQGGDAGTLEIAKLLVHAPAPRVSGAGEVPVTAGVRVPVAVGDYHGVAVADTGAEISVMMQSVAKAAHVRILGASGKVGSTTGSIVGRIGIVPVVSMDRGSLRDLPVLVLPDSQLTISDGKTTVSLPFILSVYALAQFGRVAWLDHGKRLAFGTAAPDILRRCGADGLASEWDCGAAGRRLRCSSRGAFR